MGHIQVVCFLASYLVAWGLELSRLFGRFAFGRIGSLLFTAAGLVAHTSFLIARSRETNLPPLLSSTQDWLLVLAWLMVVSYLFLTTLDRDLAIGVFLLPIICVLVSTTYFVSRDPNTRLDALRGWKMLHASLLVLGILGVTVGFVLAMMYLVQQYRLKHRQSLQEGFRIPSLEKLARLNRWSVMISVPLLTLGMGIGVGLGLYSRSSEGADAFHFTDPIVIGSGLVWLGMVALFTWLLTSPRPPGKQVASLTLWAGGFLLVTLLGLQVLTGQKLFRFGSGHAQLERGGASDSVARNTLSPCGRGQGEGGAFEIASAECIEPISDLDGNVVRPLNGPYRAGNVRAGRYPGLPHLRLGRPGLFEATFQVAPLAMQLVVRHPNVVRRVPLILRPTVSGALRCGLQNESMTPCGDVVQRAPLTLPSPARGEGVACDVGTEEFSVVRPASLAHASGYYQRNDRRPSFILHPSSLILPSRVPFA
jgi:ABC-type transport system involved in cytochrome c biogenesis permease subunit